MLHRILPLLLAAAGAVCAQKYDGPQPPKADLPYLKHASNLIPTEALTAKSEKKKDETTYTIAGANSPAKTPLASPVFLMKADKLVPDRLQLFKLESKSGHREITFGKRQPPAIRIIVTHLSENLYKIEVDESLEAAEYSLSPQDSDQVFCFAVF